MRSLAVLGTGSDVGKTVIAAALGRHAFRTGLRVAPFKAQNMANNAFVTPEGGEIGRAQALQAEACGVVPHVDHNPILLKPESDVRSQVVVHGRVAATLDARAYFEGIDRFAPAVRASLDRLRAAHELVILEGAGSAAELNLDPVDLVNWGAVEAADAAVVLVADIARGGVFAQVLGTLDLLSAERRARVVGVLVNRFRGDPTLFADGVTILERRGGVPVLGVVPWLRELDLDAEDALVRHGERPFAAHTLNVAVVLTRRMSNFTDVRALAAESDVTLRFVREPSELEAADVVVLAGSKATIADLEDLRARGFVEALTAFSGAIVGLCGGFQMLGRSLDDPEGIESAGEPRSARGIGLLDVATRFTRSKATRQATGISRLPSAAGIVVHGYEIHCGVSTPADAAPAFELRSPGDATARADGAISPDGRIWGTYLHGVFDAPEFRHAFLEHRRAAKGLPSQPLATSSAVTSRLSAELDRFADHLAAHMDVPSLFDRLRAS
jgi:adenosylcobyric acid synthase